MNTLRTFTGVIIVAILVGCAGNNNEVDQVRNASGTSSEDNSLSEKQKLGKLLFFETALSSPVGRACSNCHDPRFAFSDPESGLPVSRGSRPGLFGNRNDQPVSYSAFVPPLRFDDEEGLWKGGLFWDGRANTLAEQAMGPPFNPLEMANPDTITLFRKLQSLSYSSLFIEIYGLDALVNPANAFENMADAIQEYEKSSEVNPFSSKFDLWLSGKTELNTMEMRGMTIFVSEQKGNCAACHPNTSDKKGLNPLFTDFTYDNLGVPRNSENPYYQINKSLNPDGFDYVDLGLGAVVNDQRENGKFRVPTLRNVAVTGPYLHNGVFKTLYQVIAFYNTRDVTKWPDPEVPLNVNSEEMGNLGLTNEEIDDLVAFLNTLTDGWTGDDN
jgi:cytochrome c peroxidase